MTYPRFDVHYATLSSRTIRTTMVMGFHEKKGFFAQLVTGRRVTFSHLPGFLYFIHRTFIGGFSKLKRFYLVEESSHYMITYCDIARSYEEALERITMTMENHPDILGSPEALQSAIDKLTAKIEQAGRIDLLL
jgi:hypothetical protein